MEKTLFGKPVVVNSELDQIGSVEFGTFPTCNLDIALPVGGTCRFEGLVNGEALPVGSKYSTCISRDFPNDGELQQCDFEVVTPDQLKRLR